MFTVAQLNKMVTTILENLEPGVNFVERNMKKTYTFLNVIPTEDRQRIHATIGRIVVLYDKILAFDWEGKPESKL